MKIPSAFTRFKSRFIRDEEGSVIVLFGLTAGVLLAVGGASLDLGQNQIAKSRLMSAADAASISAATLSSPTVSTITNADRVRAGHIYFNINIPESSGPAPVPVVSVSASEIKVSAATTTSTAFVGSGTLATSGTSLVKLTTPIPADYDLVIAVDETSAMGMALTNTNRDHPGPSTRLGVIQSSIMSLLDGILPPGVDNPNVRFGITGGSGIGYITTKLPPTSNPTDARRYPGYLKVHDVATPDPYSGLISAGTMVAGGNELIFDPADPTPYYEYACTDATFTVRGGAPGSCTATKVFVGEGFGCSVECTGIAPSATQDYYSYASAPSFWYQPKTATRRTNPSFSPCSRPGMTCPGRSPTRVVVAFPAGPIDAGACRFVAESGVILGGQAMATLYIINVGITDPATIENFKNCASKDPVTHEPLYFEAPDDRALRATFHNIEGTLESIHISQ